MTLTKDEEIRKRGYKPNPQIQLPDEKLRALSEKLSSLSIAQTEYQVHQMELKDALYDAEAFFHAYYKLHKVPFLKERKFGGYKVKQVSPYRLPLFGIEDESIFTGAVIETIIESPRVSIVYSGINLSSTITEQTSCSYVHEITHTQLDHHIGQIQDFYNAEVLSVFNELFHASILDREERILKLNDSRRIYEINVLVNNLRNSSPSYPREDQLLDMQYLISNLKAYNLFITFYNGSDAQKREILEDIQSVFDCYMTVEDLLRKYEITYENSQEEKRLLKYFER